MVMMKTAKIPVVLVVGTLLFSSITVLASQVSFGPRECCFEFFNKRLKRANIVDYKFTDSLCSKKGVILTMRNGMEFCVDPSTPWLERIISAGSTVQTLSNVTSSAPRVTN